MTAGPAILQLKISLLGVSKPPVWRRVLVPATLRLDRLHNVIQAAMGWTDTHLHAFEANGVNYGPPNPELEHADERRTAIGELLGRSGDRIRYVYDFGDHWQHEIVHEKVLPDDPARRCPACLAGRGRRPPEDCGGPWGYADLRQTLADPTHEEHTGMLEWLGIETAAEFDPHAFDADEVNLVLRGQTAIA